MVKEMSVSQFAHKLKVNRSTVYRMISSKSLPPGVTSVVHPLGLVIKVDNEIFKK